MKSRALRKSLAVQHLIKGCVMNKTSKPARIALIHALSLSLAPVLQVFEEHWPEAELVNILDDSLSVDLRRAQTLTGQITRRIISLGEYAHDAGADAILFTCSAFGEAIDALEATLDIPVLKPNEAMFDEAILAGGKIGMLTTFGPSVPSMEAEFQEQAASLTCPPVLKTVLVEEAMNKLSSGDVEGHNRLLKQAALFYFAHFDIVMLAQFSTAQAFNSVSSVTSGRTLTSPKSAVLRLKDKVSPRQVR